jgi:hypothetical protein
MHSTARAVVLSLVLLPAAAIAQTGPSDPQVIAAAPTAKINVGNRKLAGPPECLRLGRRLPMPEVRIEPGVTGPEYPTQVRRRR